MSGPIREGDLAIVTKPQFCCERDGSIGRIVCVGKITSETLYCHGCGAQLTALFADIGQGSNSLCDIRRLTKIDPPAEPVSTHEPAEVIA